jgi:hypothetical protein
MKLIPAGSLAERLPEFAANPRAAARLLDDLPLRLLRREAEAALLDAAFPAEPFAP